MSTVTKIPRYPNESDVSMRLSHSYIRYKGKAAYVHATSGFALHIVQDSLQRRPLSIHPDDPDLDISSPPTGYCYDDSGPVCCWIARLPMRQQKQGLEGHSIKGHEEMANLVSHGLHGMPGLQACFEMIDGQYPSLEECIEKLAKRKAVMAIPFDRVFCLSRLDGSKYTFGLKFMGGPIGLLDSRTNTAILSHKYAGSPVAHVLAEKFTIEAQDAETT